jgi:hypothetical protein
LAQAFRLAPFLLGSVFLFRDIFPNTMSKAKGGSGGRTPASGQICVPKASVWRVTNNWRGDVGEAAFAYKAMRLGYVLSKPLGNIHRYDFVLEGSGKLWRVQVKTTAHMEAGLYSLHTRCFTQQRLGPYSAADIDFLVAYVMPEDSCYIFPVSVVAGRMSIMLRPKDFIRKRYFHRDPYARYLNAWHEFGEPSGPEF